MTWKEILRSLESIPKVLFAFTCWGTILFFVALLVWVATGSLLLGIIIGLIAVGSTVSSFLVSVPEITGLITINVLYEGIEAMRVYGTGIHFRYPWEQVKPGNYINLRQVTVEVEESYPSLDSQMLAKWLYQYTPELEGLPRYISADDNSIKRGITGTGGSILKVEIGGRTGEKCREEHDVIEGRLKDQFAGDRTASLCGRYGIRLDNVEIPDLDFDPSVQRARSAKAEAVVLREIADAYQKDKPGISDKDAMNFAFVTMDKAKKNIFEVEGLGPAVTSVLERIFGSRRGI